VSDATPGPGPASPLVCSARACRSEAVWSLLWNNPKLHAPDRRKSWLACEEHRQTLADFLAARGFLRAVEALDVPPPQASGD
jgi:hypothetical protein